MINNDITHQSNRKVRKEMQGSSKVSKCLEILLSDKSYTIITFSTMISYGLFWTIPVSLIYELKLNIGEGMRVLGYLMMILRLGKFSGHLLAIKICGYFPAKRFSEIHLASMAVQCICVVLIPQCVSWISLGIDLLLIGITLGIIESNNVFFNTAVNKASAPKYTNIYYFTFSVGCAITPIIADGTRAKILDPKKRLSFVCWIVGGSYLVFNSFLLLVVILRRKRGIFVDQIEGEKPAEKQGMHTVSYVCTAVSSFCFMCGRTILELFLLPYAMNSKAQLSEKQSYSVVQCIFASQMAIRFFGIFIAIILDKTSGILLFWNAILFLAVSFMLGFRDNSYAGIILTMVFFGLVLGSYQNSLLNWMADHMLLNNRNTAPFFVGTCIGSSLTPAVIPHLIKNKDGSVDMETYQILVQVLFFLSVVFCLAILTFELAIPAVRARIHKNTCSVKEVNILPDSEAYPPTENMAAFSELTFNEDLCNLGHVSRMTQRSHRTSIMSPLSPMI